MRHYFSLYIPLLCIFLCSSQCDKNEAFNTGNAIAFDLAIGEAEGNIPYGTTPDNIRKTEFSDSKIHIIGTLQDDGEYAPVIIKSIEISLESISEIIPRKEYFQDEKGNSLTAEITYTDGNREEYWKATSISGSIKPVIHRKDYSCGTFHLTFSLPSYSTDLKSAGETEIRIENGFYSIYAK